MQQITYREKSINTWVRIAAPGAVLLTIVALIIRQVAIGQQGIMIFLGAVAVLIAAAVFFYFCRAALVNPNRLEFDAEGLTWVASGERYRWPWRDLSGFELIQRNPLGDRLAFTVEGEGGVKPKRPRFAILSNGVPYPAFADIYEVPLAEIARRLENYRRQALGGTTPRDPAYA